MPLVYGLSNVTCEAQREAVALAELAGGVVDSHTSL
jgi:formylmethanofuran dehydrogenase subunit B